MEPDTIAGTAGLASEAQAAPGAAAGGTGLRWSPAPATAVSAAGQLPGAAGRSWLRAFVPSLSDLFFIALIAWLFMSSGEHGWKSLLSDADVGWHIRTGEYVLNRHAVPHHDLYSFSKPGAPWYAWEWLTDVIDALLFRASGLKGVVLMAGLLIAAFATTLVRRMVSSGANLFVTLLVALMGVGAASMHFLARPHVITLALLSISMWMIEADRRRQSGRIWMLVPVSLVWTNLHGGFVVLIAVLGLAAVGSAIEAWAGKRRTGAADWARARRYAGLAAGCAAVSLVNPYGWQLHAHIMEYLRSDWIRRVVQEFQSPSFRDENMLQFEALLFVGLMAAGTSFRSARVTEGLWVLFCGYEALSSIRHVPVFVAITAPMIAREMTSWWAAWAGGAPRNSAAGILNQISTDLLPGFQRNGIWPVLFAAGLALPLAPILWPKDFPEQVFPIKLIHAHEQEILRSRVLTTDQWADYLIFLHPEQKVFVDGRSDFYGPEIGDRFLGLVSGRPGWEKTMKDYGFDLVLLPTDTPLIQLLKGRPEWREAAHDDKRTLLVRTKAAVPVLEQTH
jgi:hypothetical protein